MMMTWSKFIMVAVFTLALIFATRWCVVMFYSQTYVPTDSRSISNSSHLGFISKPPPREEETPASTLAPEYKAFQTTARER